MGLGGNGIVYCGVVVLVDGLVVLGAFKKDGPACDAMLLFCPSKNFLNDMIGSIYSSVCELWCLC